MALSGYESRGTGGDAMFGWFKKNQIETPLVAPPQVSALQEGLLGVITGHGLDVHVYHDWCLVDNAMPGLRAIQGPIVPNSAKITNRIDIELRLKADRAIYECYGGVGEDEHAAMGDVLYTFCCGTFHVYLSAFWDHHEPGQVDIETWSIHGQEWIVYVGNAIFKTYNNQAFGLAPDYGETIRRLASGLPLGEDYHWISVYIHALNGQVGADTSLDNQPWPELNESLAHLAWPAPATGFASSRNFILLKRQA